MRRLKLLLSAVMAGVCIALGGGAYLSVESKVLGAMFFVVGLFTICAFGFHLFTGKVCYAGEKDLGYALDLPVIWLGNLLGTGAVAGLLRLTRVGPDLAARAAAVCQPKTGDSLLSLVILGILCNIFIYIAVEGFRAIPHQVGKYLALFLGVMVFILCGFEHCVADMFYFWMGGWSNRAVAAIAVITLGNSLGGIAFHEVRRRLAKES